LILIENNRQLVGLCDGQKRVLKKVIKGLVDKKAFLIETLTAFDFQELFELAVALKTNLRLSK